MEMPILDYIRSVVDEHVVPTGDDKTGITGIVVAVWIVDLLNHVESLDQQ